MSGDAPPESGDQHPAVVEYVVNDERRGRPAHRLELPVDDDGLRRLVEDGWVQMHGVIDAARAVELGRRIDELADRELGSMGARRLRGNGYYVRDIERKDGAFHPFVTWPPMLALARAVLGPQVRVRLDARIAFEDEPGAGVPWHIHFPAVPDPLPPFWSHPHNVAALVYLDDVDEDEGALVVASGSHLDFGLRSGDVDDRYSAVALLPRRGDAVMMHGNLWHRTEPSAAGAGRRRVLFVGYTAAWVVGDSFAGGQPEPGSWDAELIEPSLGDDIDQQQADELLGRFRW